MICIEEALKIAGNFIFHSKQADALTLAHFDEESHFSEELFLSKEEKIDLIESITTAFGLSISKREMLKQECISDIFKVLMSKKMELKIINQNIAA